MAPKRANMNPNSKGSTVSTPSSDLLPICTFTVRPPAAAHTPKAFLRVHLHRQSLQKLSSKSGDLIELAKASATNSLAEVTWIPGIIWLATDPQLQRHCALLSEAVKDRLGISFENEVLVRKYLPEVDQAGVVVVKEVESDIPVPPMVEEQMEGWKWQIENSLFEGKYIYEGIHIITEFKGTKRRFRIESVTPADQTQSPMTPPPTEDGIRIPVFRITESTAVQLEGHITASTSFTKPASQLETLVIRPPPPVSVPSTPQRQTPRKSISKGAPPGTPAPNASKVDNITFKPSSTKFSNIGGMASTVTHVRDMVSSVLDDSSLYSSFGLAPTRGILLTGPPGTGKTMLLQAIACELDVNSYAIDGRVMGKYMGESEAQVRKIFDEAKKNQPAIIFMDEVDSLAPKQGSGEGSEGRVVSTLLTELDVLEEAAKDGTPLRVAVVAATSRPSALDERLRRAGRFESEVEVSVPDKAARKDILGLQMRKLPFETEDEMEKCLSSLAGKTHGFVGADLLQLVRSTVQIVVSRRRDKIRRLPEQDGFTDSPPIPEMRFTELDFEEALKDVKPSALREIVVEVAPVRWSDIGGQEEVKNKLQETVEWPLRHPAAFTRLGVRPRKGVILYGPPGCSKTLVARALATEAGVNFLLVKGPELLNMYVGESERRLRETFRKARAASPSIIFFDEIDSLCSSRGSNSDVGTNMVATLLNELDGLTALRGVVVVGATNRPDILDSALVRPGRFDTMLYVRPPDFEGRKEILGIAVGKMKVADDVDLEGLARETEGFSGAEVVSLCDEAGHCAMREDMNIPEVAMRHFEEARRKMVPQITEEMVEFFEDWAVSGVRKL